MIVQGSEEDQARARELLRKDPRVRALAPLAREIDDDEAVRSSARVYVGVLGFYTDIKVAMVLTGLRTRYELPNLAVSDTFTASTSLERHLSGLDFADKLLTVEVVHGINDFVRFLGGTGDVQDESEIVATDSFALYKNYFQDRQNVLAHESEKLRAYELLTQRRSVALYETIRRANTFLIAWGTLFLTATLVLSILSAFGVVDWKAAAVTGGLSLAQFVGAFFTQPSSDMQRNLTNLAVFKMVLESHSLKTAVARFHLTTPQALRELHTKLDAGRRRAPGRRVTERAGGDRGRQPRRLRGAPPARLQHGRGAWCQRPPLPATEPLRHPARTARPRRRASPPRGARRPSKNLAARHFAGSDRANATPRSTRTASSASARTDSLSTRIQPGISRPRITTSRADDSSTRRSESAGSTRSMSPPWPLADTAMLPCTRNARPPNIRCSRTPSSSPSSARMRAASSSSYATASMPEPGATGHIFSSSLVSRGDEARRKDRTPCP